MEWDEEIGLSWRVLAWISAQGEQARNSPVDQQRLGPLYAEVTRIYNPAGSYELHSLAVRSSASLALSDNRCLLLKPDDKGVLKLPVLRVGHCKRDGGDIVRYEIGLFIPVPGAGDSSYGAIGVRFEMPEGADGLHSYYHTQLCRHFQGETKPFRGCPPWLPDQHPAIPIDADGPLSLLIALLKSLYGNTFLPELQKNAELWEEIRGAADDGGSLRRLLVLPDARGPGRAMARHRPKPGKRG